MTNYLSVTVTSNLNLFNSERRFNADLKVSDLKDKLELLTGAQSGSMQIELRSNENVFISTLNDPNQTLESAGVSNGHILHVKDNQSNGLDDCSNVEKFELSDEAYAARTDSVRAWKEREKLGRFDEKARKEKEEKEKIAAGEAEALAKTFQIGDRCEVRLTNQPAKRGTVAFVGQTDFKPGMWVGVRYDEPMGKNDGTIRGKRYFECLPKYGGFIRPQDLVVGDFPELGLDDEIDEI